MKRCQKCSRTFPDENQKFCTFDGGLLMADAPTFDPNRTILAPQMPSVPPPSTPLPAAPAPPPTPKAPERDMSETIVAYRPPEKVTPAEPLTSPSGSQTAPDLSAPPVATSPGMQTSRDLVAPVPPAPAKIPPPPPPAPPPSAPVSAAPPAPPSGPTPAAPPSATPPAPRPHPQVQQPPPPVPPTPPTSAQQAKTETLPPPTSQQAKPAKKRSIVPWIIGILVVLLLGAAGLVAAAYVFRGEIREFLKPYLDSKSGSAPKPANENSNANSSTNTNTNSANTNSSGNANTETKKEPPAFVPPADAVQFTNSKDTLDGDLADHYVGFSFYYPKTFTKDPKAGVHGSTSFAKVDRQFSDSTGEFIQERAVVTWYPSNGAYESDLSIYPEHATKFTRNLPNYEEVSRGETTVNTYKAYEVRFKGEFKNGNKSLPYWGRVIFLPPATENEKTGVAIVMLATSYASGVTSSEDVGVKGELPMILESFRFAPKP